MHFKLYSEWHTILVRGDVHESPTETLDLVRFDNSH